MAGRPLPRGSFDFGCCAAKTPKVFSSARLGVMMFCRIWRGVDMPSDSAKSVSRTRASFSMVGIVSAEVMVLVPHVISQRNARASGRARRGRGTGGVARRYSVDWGQTFFRQNYSIGMATPIT